MPTQLGKITSAWLSYLDEVVPKDASAQQVTETKRAFFAGAQACLSDLLALGCDDVPENAGVAVLEELRLELQAFGRSVGTGGN